MSFKPARGCFIQTISNGSDGFYKVSGLDSPLILIQGVDSHDKEIHLPVATLDNKRILYSFGKDFGDINVRGLIILGESGNPTGALGQVLQWFEEKRLSKSLAPVEVSLPGGKGYMMYPTGLALSEPDPEFHLQPFAVIGLIAEP